jgi:multicomponent Na+:H+ antiporter subunit G
MTLVIAIVGIVLKLAGVVFLFAAALGVLRFKDVLQRMHAATKAGTIGAGLVILGSLASASDVETIIIGLLAIVFLLFTAPVAGHLLGRAAYVTGAPLQSFASEDPLVSILQQRKRPPEWQDQAVDAVVESAGRS